jgi:hypothetical protein
MKGSHLCSVFFPDTRLSQTNCFLVIPPSPPPPKVAPRFFVLNWQTTSYLALFEDNTCHTVKKWHFWDLKKKVSKLLLRLNLELCTNGVPPLSLSLPHTHSLSDTHTHSHKHSQLLTFNQIQQTLTSHFSHTNITPISRANIQTHISTIHLSLSLSFTLSTPTFTLYFSFSLSIYLYLSDTLSLSLSISISLILFLS